jgi:hypothetical protein
MEKLDTIEKTQRAALKKMRASGEIEKVTPKK